MTVEAWQATHVIPVVDLSSTLAPPSATKQKYSWFREVGNSNMMIPILLKRYDMYGRRMGKKVAVNARIPFGLFTTPSWPSTTPSTPSNILVGLKEGIDDNPTNGNTSHRFPNRIDSVMPRRMDYTLILRVRNSVMVCTLLGVPIDDNQQNTRRPYAIKVMISDLVTI